MGRISCDIALTLQRIIILLTEINCVYQNNSIGVKLVYYKTQSNFVKSFSIHVYFFLS